MVGKLSYVYLQFYFWLQEYKKLYKNYASELFDPLTVYLKKCVYKSYIWYIYIYINTGFGIK